LAIATVPVTFVAFPDTLPVKLAVIVPALKFPDPSLATTVLAVFAFVALDVIVGLPDTPLPLVTERPVPETATDLATVVFAVVRAINPLPPGSFMVSNATRAPEAVVAPVPPDAIGRAVPRVKEAAWFIASTTFVPLLNTHMLLPAGTAMPVPVVFLTVTVSARPLLMM
jgi:hypothetical protein